MLYPRSSRPRLLPTLAAASAMCFLGMASATAAFSPIPNLFAGNNGANPTSVTVSGLVLAGDTQTDVIGPDFTGTVSVGAGIANTLSEIINQGSNGQMVVSGSGLASVANFFSASKTFAGNTLDDFTTYQFTLTKTAGSLVTVLGGTNVALTLGATTVANTANGVGLLGAVNLLNLFNTSNTATFTFTTGDVNNAVPLTATITGSTVLTIGGSNFTFTGASLAAVPEPGSYAMLAMLGAAGLAGWRLRRRAVCAGI